MKPVSLCILVLVFCSQFVQASPLEVQSLKRTKPRPLSIQILQFSLADKSLQPTVVIANDPDGKGPAEAQLTNPLVLAESKNLYAGVNANAWANLPEKPGEVASKLYIPGGHANIVGWAVSDGQQRSAPQSSVWSFWIDSKGRGRIGTLTQPVDARWAVSGFGGLLKKGAILPKEGGPLHPRSAIGLDAKGQKVTLVVVDGRQPGFSEGMTTRELAVLMKELGCTDALNLDGGGSSILLYEGRILNHPSDIIGPRPVPVMFGVQRKL
jgi:hypothetical protein